MTMKTNGLIGRRCRLLRNKDNRSDQRGTLRALVLTAPKPTAVVEADDGTLHLVCPTKVKMQDPIVVPTISSATVVAGLLMELEGRLDGMTPSLSEDSVMRLAKRWQKENE